MLFRSVDTNMARVGHGAGFYDRFFDSLGYRPVIVFVSIKDMYIDDKICDAHDICADRFIFNDYSGCDDGWTNPSVGDFGNNPEK